MKMRYHTVQKFTISMFKSKDTKYQLLRILRHKFKKITDSWGSYTATGSESTEREQGPCNTLLNRALHKHDYIISPTRHREIVETSIHPEIDTKWFIEAKNQMQRVFKKENQMPKHLPLKMY